LSKKRREIYYLEHSSPQKMVNKLRREEIYWTKIQKDPL